MRHATEAPTKSWTERHQGSAAYPAVSHQRQPFHNAHSSLGAAGHFLHMGIAAAPFFIAEFAPEGAAKMKLLRTVPVVGALAAEGVWTLHAIQERKAAEEAKTALAACREQGRSL